MVKERKIRVAIYARVSTADKGQNPEVQLMPLREYCQARGWSIVDEYVDIGISGAKDKRPQLDRLMNDARKRKVDCIAVHRLDRWGRSLKHLILSLTELQDVGVSFVSYSENIDLSSPAGKMLFHVIGAMAEFERELIRERVKAGIQTAKAKGKKLGRKPVPPVVTDQIKEMREAGQSIRAIAKKTKLSIGGVHKILGKMGLQVAVMM